LLDDIEIVGEAEKGRTAIEAARELRPERTARTHVSDILGKLGLASRTQAAVYAVEHGLVPPA
jgi:DNA-binding NarL/FixJ family response regulator